MKSEIMEAIESARTVAIDTLGIGPHRKRSIRSIRAVVLAVVRELPDEMTISELRDELEISNNQDER